MAERPQPACLGRGDLFDSTEREDHERAAAICAGCPVQDWCDDYTRKAKRLVPAGMTLHGTWAGRLQGVPKLRDWARIAREDAAYGIEEAARAHAAYRRGDRGAWAEVGHHVHERRRARAKRERTAVA